MRNGAPEDTKKSSEVDKPLLVAATLPDSLIQRDGNIRRTYQVIRVHNGVADVLDATFRAADKSLTFQTDRFSTYAVVYRDEVIPSTVSPKTGDSARPLTHCAFCPCTLPAL